MCTSKFESAGLDHTAHVEMTSAKPRTLSGPTTKAYMWDVYEQGQAFVYTLRLEGKTCDHVPSLQAQDREEAPISASCLWVTVTPGAGEDLLTLHFRDAWHIILPWDTSADGVHAEGQGPRGDHRIT